MDKEQKFLREGKLYYDATNKREREFEFEEVGSTKAAYDKLRLYNAVSERRASGLPPAAPPPSSPPTPLVVLAPNLSRFKKNCNLI